MSQLQGRKVAVLVTDLFEQVELTEPVRALRDAGATVTIIAPRAGKVQGVHHDKKGDAFDVDMTLKDARPDAFDAVLLPGGAMNADALRMDKDAQAFVKAVEKAQKPVAVICHGGWLLASSGLVRGHTMTSWPSIQDDLKNAGANWVDEEVCRDRNWVSSRKPDDIPAFNREMVKLFAERQNGAQRGEQQVRH